MLGRRGRRQPVQSRSSKEERYLWAILNELDKEEYKNEERIQAKEQGVVASARKKMGAGKNQPSMKQMFLAPNKPTHPGNCSDRIRYSLCMCPHILLKKQQGWRF